MFRYVTFLIWYFIQIAPPDKSAVESAFEKFGWLVITAAVTALITYFATRKKNEADINKLIAETIKSYITTIKEIQETNQNLFEKIQNLRGQVSESDDRRDEMKTLLEIAQKQLEDCLRNSCIGCDEVLEHALLTIQKVGDFLKDAPEAAGLLDELRALSLKIAEKRKVEVKN